MANQPADKRQQFRFWYPFWGNPSAPAASRPPVPAPRRTPTTQPKPRSPLPSSSSSSSSPSPSSSPAKQNQPRRVPRTPSSPLPSPRRSPPSDQVKQNMRDESAQRSKQSPQTTPTPSRPPSPSKGIESSLVEASNKLQGEQVPNKEPIGPKPQDSKPEEGTVDKPTFQASNYIVEKEIGSNNSEEIEPRSVPFDPPTSEKLAGTDEDEKAQEKHHEPEPQVGLVPPPSTVGAAAETQTKEHDKSIPPDHNYDINHQENNEMPKENNTKESTMTPRRDDICPAFETIKEIAEPSQDENLKEKERAQPTDLNNLSSNYNTSTETTVPTTNNSNSDHEGRRETEINPKHKEKIVAGSGSHPTTSVRKGIKDGISKLIRKINTENAFNHASESGTCIITLAGENKGASMYIGHHGNEGHSGTFTGRARKLDESAGAKSSEGMNEIEIERDSRISANVNSNVQSVNNSMLQESRCDTRDPGVHFRFSSIMHNEEREDEEERG